MLLISTLFALTQLERLQAAVKDAGVSRLLECAESGRTNDCISERELKRSSVDTVMEFFANLESDPEVLNNEKSNPLFEQIKNAMLSPEGISKLPRSCSTFSTANICSAPSLRKRALGDEELDQIRVVDDKPDIERPAVDNNDPELGIVIDNKRKSRGVRKNNGGTCTIIVLVVGLVVLGGSIAGIAIGSIKISKQQEIVDGGSKELTKHCDWVFTCKPGVNLPEYRTVTYYELVSHCYLPPTCTSNGNGGQNCYGGGPSCYWNEQRSRQEKINYLDRITGAVNPAEILGAEIGLGLCEKHNNGDTDDAATCKGYASDVGQLKKKRDINWAYLAPSIVGVLVGLGMVIGAGCGLAS